MELGRFWVRSTISVADAAYAMPQPALSVVVAAASGEWAAEIQEEVVSAPDRAAWRALVAWRAGERQGGEVRAWEVLEPRLCCDTCDVIIADAAFRVANHAHIRAMGSGDALVAVDGPEGQAGGARGICCYDPWRCEVAVIWGGAGEPGGAREAIAVRARWFSSATGDRWMIEGEGDARVQYRLEDGELTVIGADRYERRSLDDLYFNGIEEELSELGIPAAFCAQLRPTLLRYGADRPVDPGS